MVRGRFSDLVVKTLGACLASGLVAGIPGVGVAFTAPANLTMPTGASFAQGTGTIADPSSTSMIITTNQPSTIIDWQTFSIPAGDTVDFQQPSSNSVVVNNVETNNPSDIMGNLDSNGQVFLINPSGIVFGAGSEVNTAGLVASTLGITNQEFDSGEYDFSGTTTAGVANYGTISVSGGGDVFLIGSTVVNENTITTQGGTVWLAAGQSVNITNAANPNISYLVTAPANTAVNVGTIIASGGTVVLMGGTVEDAGEIDTATATSGGNIDLLSSSDVTTTNKHNLH